MAAGRATLRLVHSDATRERDEYRAWIASNWRDIARVLRRRGESDIRIARLKRELLGA